MKELAGDTVSAGAFAHPAALTENQFASIKSTTCFVVFCPILILHANPITDPLFMSCAENDVAFDTPSRRKAEDVLKREGKKYHVQLFGDLEHGFALKGDKSSGYERKLSPRDITNILVRNELTIA